MMNIAAHSQYEKFREIDLEIVKEIPRHWQVWKIAHAFQQIGSGTTPDTGRNALYDGEISWLQTGDLTDGAVYDTRKKISQLAIREYSTLKVYPSGSLVMAMYGATIGKLGMLQMPAATNQACCVFSKSEIVTSDFAFYSLLAMRPNILSDAYGGGQPNISQQTIKALQLIVPPLPEQRAIAAFLDEKCAKIDEAVKIKEDQIALLRERRQIIIQDAVTRGLNPAAPMKDSGIDWIGRIPEHWEVKRLRFLGDAVIGLTYDPKDLCGPDEGTLVLRSSNLKNGRFVYGEAENVYIDMRIPKKLYIQKDDILICSRNGSRDLIGKCAIADVGDVGASFGAFTTVFRSKINPYLFQILNSDIFRQLSGSFLTATINQLTTTNLNSISVPIPPESEREEILDFLNPIKGKIETVVALKERQIAALKEYKTSLINAAVTGKIKVI